MTAVARAQGTTRATGAPRSRRVCRALVACATLAAASVAPPLQAQAPVAEAVAQILTSGRGEVRVTPDRATLSLSVETRRLTAAEASRENARLQQAVFDSLRSLGLSADQLSTTDYSVVPEQRWNQSKQQSEIVGYVVRNTVRVQIRQLDQLGRLIDAALGKGSNVVSALELYASNTDGARRDALAKAVEQARADADVMARAAGGAVGGLLELSTETEEPPSIRPVMRAANALSATVVDTPIGTGSQTLHVRVSARWRFVPDRR